MAVIRSSRFIDDSRYLTVLGDWDNWDFRLRSFSGTEAISHPFEFELDLYSEDLRIPFKDVIGKRVAVGIQHRGELGRRWFNGFISRFVRLPNETRMARYRAVMVPWLWFLGQTSDCRIFQKQTVPEIVTTLLREYGLVDFAWRLEGSYEPWDYCVQYRETALNFIMRLLEQEGIRFFFEHSLEKHTLIFADGLTHPECPMSAKVRYEHSFGEGVLREEDVVFAWRHEHNFQSGRYALQDYNFEKPLHNLAAEAPSVVVEADRRFEIYDFPGEYEGRTGGEDWAKIRMQEAETAHATVFGDGCCRTFTSGHRFEIDQLEHSENGRYVLTSVTHRARETAGHSAAAGQGLEYENSFTCLPVEVQYRPPRLTPKPFVQGSQTATVVGPGGKEIHTDEYGQVKVHFHWDRRSGRDHNSSCWIRVSQPWAGENWGAISIPRIGQEVIVDFLEGDPDRPIITGRVYNARQKPPYDLPGGERKMGIRSRSTPGGGGYNEVMLDDTKGSEGITIHAQYNMQTRVENDDSLSIGNNQTVDIGVNRTETVGVDETVAIGNNRTETVGNNKADVVTNAYTMDCDTMVITAGTSITLQCGASKIHMNQAGIINISGVMITVAAAAVANVAAPLTNISGAVMSTFTGGITVLAGGATHVMGGVTRVLGGTVKVNC